MQLGQILLGILWMELTDTQYIVRVSLAIALKYSHDTHGITQVICMMGYPTI